MSKESIATTLYKELILPNTAPFCEQTHHTVSFLLEQFQKSDIFLELLRREFRVEDGNLRVDAFGVEFPNSFLLAAGMDKDAKAVGGLAALGVGGIEVGSFTFQACKGNPLVRKETLPSGRTMRIKRMERFSDGTVINWMGFPGVGTREAVRNLRTTRKKANVPVGVNVAVSPGLEDEGMRKADLRQSLELVYPIKPAWTTLDISCPNTEEDLRLRFQKIEEGEEIMVHYTDISEDLETRFGFRIPRLVKIGPDMQEEEISRNIETVKRLGYDGVVATNTTVDRSGPRAKYSHIAKGGLSGPLLFEKSLETVRMVRKFDQVLGGNPLVIIGCGGIDSVEKWQQMREAGADLCQVLTGFVFGGPYFFKKMNREYSRSIY